MTKEERAVIDAAMRLFKIWNLEAGADADLWSAEHGRKRMALMKACARIRSGMRKK